MNGNRQVVGALIVATGLISAAFAGNQTNQFDGIALTTIHAGGKVYMVQRPGGGGNVAVFVGTDGVLLVDSMFAPLADRLVAAVRKVTDREVRFLINTHVHPDHIGGNEPLATRGVLIFATTMSDSARSNAFAFRGGAGNSWSSRPPRLGQSSPTTTRSHFT